MVSPGLLKLMIRRQGTKLTWLETLCLADDLELTSIPDPLPQLLIYRHEEVSKPVVFLMDKVLLSAHEPN